MTRLQAGVAFFALAMLLALSPVEVSGENITGERAPDWRLECLCGRKLSSSKFEGKPVLMDFGSIFCADCQDMAFHLADMHEKYGQRGLEVVFVNVDGASYKGAVRSFMKGVGARYITVFDEDFRTAEAFGAATIPYLVLVDAKGAVRASGYAGKGRVIPESAIEEVLEDADDALPRR